MTTIDDAILDIEDEMVVAAMEHVPGCDHDDMVSAIEAALKAKLATPAVVALRTLLAHTADYDALKGRLEEAVRLMEPFAAEAPAWEGFPDETETFGYVVEPQPPVSRRVGHYRALSAFLDREKEAGRG